MVLRSGVVVSASVRIGPSRRPRFGVSGDSSPADHNIAWRTRAILELDYVPAGVSSRGDDNIIFDITDGASAGGFGHPHAIGGNEENEATIADSLPVVRSVEEEEE